jgi:pimeloyl-ACP methyl ester carboxylesterase
MGEGTNFSALALLKVMMSAELVATNKDMPVPFFIIQGKDDIWTPTSLAIDYFNGVAAPKKALTVIEGAGHFALDTHREEFIKALLQDLKLSTK